MELDIQILLEMIRCKDPVYYFENHWRINGQKPTQGEIHKFRRYMDVGYGVQVVKPKEELIKFQYGKENKEIRTASSDITT